MSSQVPAHRPAADEAGATELTVPHTDADVSAATEPSDEARVAGRPWPLWLALPGLVWWALNVAILVAGLGQGRGVGYRAWRAGRPELSRRLAVLLEAAGPLERIATPVRDGFDRALAWTAAPTVLLALLCAGAVLTVRGRRGWRSVLAAWGAATAAGVLLALVLAGGVALLEAVD